MAKKRLQRLTEQQGFDLFRLLIPDQQVAKLELSDGENVSAIPVLIGIDGVNADITESAHYKKICLEAVVAIDELLVRYDVVRETLSQQRDQSTKRRGRPRNEGRHWLAREIAGIAEDIPGFSIEASKSGTQTRFMMLLSICFKAVGETGKVEHYAVEAAKPKRPAIVNDATWNTFCDERKKK
jgi:hypothetical protein